MAMSGIECVVTGESARRWTRPFAAVIELEGQSHGEDFREGVKAFAAKRKAGFTGR